MAVFALNRDCRVLESVAQRGLLTAALNDAVGAAPSVNPPVTGDRCDHTFLLTQLLPHASFFSKQSVFLLFPFFSLFPCFFSSFLVEKEEGGWNLLTAASLVTKAKRA